MDVRQHQRLSINRRHFFGRAGFGLASAALSTLLDVPPTVAQDAGRQLHFPNFAPTAKRVIYLFQSGGPSQIELFDYKPNLEKWQATELPESVRMGQRITTMTSGQAGLPIAPSMFSFAQHGQNGTWVSELLPHTAKVVDDLCIVRSMHTEAINHDPAITFFQTGTQQRWSAQHWRVARLWAGKRCGGPASVCRFAIRQGRPTTVRSSVGQRVPALDLSRREISLGW